MPADETVYRRAALANILQLALAVLIGFCSGAQVAYFALRGMLDDSVNRHLEPYDGLFHGTELMNSYMYDDAIREFERVFPTLTEARTRPTSSARISAYIDRYLTCLASCEKPDTYRSQFEKCRELFKTNVVTETAEHQIHDGWYMLLIGDPDQASAYFEKAAKAALVVSHGATIASAHNGICWLKLCLGDPNAALVHFQEAGSRDAVNYQYFVYDPTAADQKRLTDLYSPFAPAATQLIKLMDPKPAKKQH